jgi:hypothetical protein
MTKQELETFEERLKENGYKKYNGYKESDYTYYKSFGIGNNKYDEYRSNYLIGFLVYDFSEYAHRDDFLKDSPYSIHPIIMVSRVVDERVDLDVVLDVNKDDIERVESLAESFFKWVEDNISIKKV